MESIWIRSYRIGAKSRYEYDEKLASEMLDWIKSELSSEQYKILFCVNPVVTFLDEDAEVAFRLRFD